MQNKIIEKLSKEQCRQWPFFGIGDRLAISIRLKEGEKERIQVFRGVVIAKHPKSMNGPEATVTVRKVSEGVGVERIFPLSSPVIEKIQVEGSSRVRRSRLYFLRALKGRKARLKEIKRFGDAVAAPLVAAGTEPEIVPSDAPQKK